MNRWTWHGGGLAAARAHFGDGERPWIDLSTGINPHAWPGVDALEIDWRRLPDEADLRQLEATAAARFGAEPGHVCAVPGTEVGLRLVGRMLPPPTRHLAPSYRTHGEMTSAPLDEDRGETLILANPNNPDGRLFDRSVVSDLLEGRGAGSWLVVDEAFADVTPEASVADRVADGERLIVFRSFGKFFGLAGVRLGFVIAPPASAETVRAQLGAWPLSAAAIAIGLAAYRDSAWIAAMRDRLDTEAGALDAVLARAGFTPRGACPLFRLIECNDAGALFEHLARRAILTRPFDEQPRWLRVGLPGNAEELARLEAALRDA